VLTKMVDNKLGFAVQSYSALLSALFKHFTSVYSLH